LEVVSFVVRHGAKDVPESNVYIVVVAGRKPTDSRSGVVAVVTKKGAVHFS
jgi:hypothetical protein